MRRAPRAQRSDILTIVVAVQQTHLSRIRSRNAVENLPDDGFGVETLGVGVEGTPSVRLPDNIPLRTCALCLKKHMSETFAQVFAQQGVEIGVGERDVVTALLAPTLKPVFLE